jgi:hypothetical protein
MLSKPIQADNNHSNVDEAEIGDDGEKVQHKLLVRLEVFDIDTTQGLAVSTKTNTRMIVRIQPGLSVGAACEEKCIDDLEVAIRREDQESQQRAKQDPRVWNGKCQSTQRNSGSMMT